MRFWNLALILMLIVGVLVGCGGDVALSSDDATSTVEQGSPAQDPAGNAVRESYTGGALDTSYEGTLPASTQLALGTVKLEGTENAVTLEQAKTLLPLWQAIEGGSLQSEAETDAVVRQIEGAMTTEQLATIAAMRLTFEDLGAWMEERGVNLGLSPEARATRQAAGGGQGGFGDLSQEERAAMRATAQVGGGFGGEGGPFGNMSEEERAAMRATAEASGMTFPGGGRGGTGRGQLAVLAESVVELLTQRAAE